VVVLLDTHEDGSPGSLVTFRNRDGHEALAEVPEPVEVWQARVGEIWSYTVTHEKPAGGEVWAWARDPRPLADSRAAE
jgi:hypothetical protein